MLVSPKSARLGKMRSRPNKCSSERPCLSAIACWRHQTSHKPIKRVSICVDSAYSFSHTWISLRAFGGGTTDPPTLFEIALGCGKLRSSCGKLRSRLRAANWRQNAKMRQTCAGAKHAFVARTAQLERFPAPPPATRRVRALEHDALTPKHPNPKEVDFCSNCNCFLKSARITKKCSYEQKQLERRVCHKFVLVWGFR